MAITIYPVTPRATTLGRRRFLTLAGGVAASAILAACGDTGSPTDTPRPASPTTGAAPTAGAAPTTAAASAVGSPTVTRAAGTATTGTTPAGSAVAGTGPAGTAAASVTGTTTAAGSAVTGTRPAGSVVTGTTGAGSAVTGTTSAGAAGQMLVIEATEYAFKTLGTIPGGITTVQMRNLGKENHEASLVRLNDGVTLEQFLAALQQQGEPPNIFTFEGGPAEIVPNKTAEVILELQAGQYVVLCFTEAPDKQPHVAKGMFLPLRVTAATGVGTLPAGKGTITLGAANGFDLPTTLTAGKNMLRVTNQGKGPRAFFVGGIPNDKTIDDINKELANPDAPPPPWFTANGGMDGLKPNGSGVVTLDLAAGKYAAVDIAFGPEKPFGKVFTIS